MDVEKVQFPRKQPKFRGIEDAWGKLRKSFVVHPIANLFATISGVRLNLAFGSENGQEVAVYISEVGDPVGWRHLVRFSGE